MDYEITLRTTPASPTAVVALGTDLARVPRVWPVLLDECARPGRWTAQTGHNVMLFHDDVPNVEVGVQVAGPFTGAGRVTASELPGGRIATTVHRGPYDDLDAAHARGPGARPTATRSPAPAGRSTATGARTCA